jgi:hypothetical protein
VKPDDQDEFDFTDPDFSNSHFNGPDYDPALDNKRLRKQIGRVFDCMAFDKWRTLREIERITGDPPASISAQLRHLRKARFGHYIVERRRCGAEDSGLFEYRLLPPEKKAQ